MQYRYTLDKSTKKHFCPQCKEKRFVLYLDNTTNKPLNECVGRCDKETTCSYHYTPKQYFRDYPQAKEQSNNTAFVVPTSLHAKENTPCRVMTLLPFSYVEKCKSRNIVNNFITFLLSVFPFEKVEKAVSMYHVGTSNRWNGATVFWQIDENMQVRTGKILLYNTETGKRIKYANYVPFDFVHKIMIREKLVEKFSLVQCLFGLHLAASQPQKIIAAVESEKTAVIMSIILPQYLWVSFGGINNISQINTPILKDRQIIVFPDAGTYDHLQPKINELQNVGFNICLSDLVEKNATTEQIEKGFDLADFALLEMWHKEVNHTTFTKMVQRNSNVNLLAYLFDCKIL